MSRRRRLLGGVLRGFESAFDSASGVRAALILDYAGVVGGQFYDGTSNTLSFDALHTFSRASLATQKDSAGLVKFVPHNLFTHSEQLAGLPSTGWSLTGGGSGEAQVTLSNGLGGASFVNGDRHLVESIALTPDTFTMSCYVEPGATFTGNIIKADNFGGATGTLSAKASDADGNGLVSITFTIASGDLVGNMRFGQTQAGSGTLSVGGFQLNRHPMAPANDTFADTYVPTEASVVHQHRLDHDKDGNRIGLLIEEARTNSIFPSADFGTTWTESGTSVVSTNTTVAPDGTTTADTLTDDDGGSFELLNSNTVTVSNSQTWTGSLYVLKDSVAKTTRFMMFRLKFTEGTNTTFDVMLDTSTGEVVGEKVSGTGVLGAVSAVDSGNYWRISLTVTNNATGNTDLLYSIYPAVGANATMAVANYSTAATGSSIVWGAQLELGAFPSSCIPTVTVPVTRAAESCKVAVSNFAWDATKGAWFVDAGGDVGVLDNNTATVIGSNITSGEFIRRSTTNDTKAQCSIGINTTNTNGAASWVAGAKAAMAWDATNADVSFSGATTTTTAGTVVLGSVTDIHLGTRSGNALEWNSHIQSASHFGSRLSNADLEAWGTP